MFLASFVYGCLASLSASTYTSHSHGLQINGNYEKQINKLQENLVSELQEQYTARNPLLAEIPEFWKQTLRNAFRHYLTDLDHTILDDLVQVSAAV